MIPLLPVAIALMAGILLEGVAGDIWWCLPVLGIFSVSLVFRKIYPAMLSLCVMAGFLMASAHRDVPLRNSLCHRELEWSGVVMEHREYDGAQMLILRADSCGGEPCGKLTVKCLMPSLLPAVDERDRVRFVSDLQPLADNVDLPDEIDVNSRLRMLGVTAETVISPDSVRLVSPEPGLLNDIRRLRRAVQRVIAEAPVGETAGGFLIAALTGDRSWLHDGTRELFTSTGIAHVLALSGLHVAILTVVLTVLLLPLTSVVGGRYGRLALIMLAIWIFAVMTGLQPSVVRAAVMATMFGLTAMLQRVWSPLNSLSAAVIIILLFSPFQIYTLGFSLTFLSVLSIILFANKLNPVSYKWPRMRDLAGYLCMSLAAMLGAGVVCAWQFHVFPTYFLLANMAVSVLLPLLLGGGVVLLLLNILGVKAIWLGAYVDGLMDAVDGVAWGFSQLPGAVVRDLWMPWWIVAVYFVGLLFFGIWLYRRRLVYIVSALAVCIAGVVMSMVGDAPTYTHGELYITRSATETTMIIMSGLDMHLFTTAPFGRQPDVVTTATHRYGNYMLRRNIPAVSLLVDGYADGGLARRGSVVSALGKKFVFVSHASHVRRYVVRPDYVVVCRGFRGDIVKLARQMEGGVVLLSRDLNLRRHDRYARELREAAVAYRSLRDEAFHLAM